MTHTCTHTHKYTYTNTKTFSCSKTQQKQKPVRQTIADITLSRIETRILCYTSLPWVPPSKGDKSDTGKTGGQRRSAIYQESSSTQPKVEGKGGVCVCDVTFCVCFCFSFFLFSLSSPSTHITSSQEPNCHVTKNVNYENAPSCNVMTVIDSETTKLCNVMILSGRVCLSMWWRLTSTSCAAQCPDLKHGRGQLTQFRVAAWRLHCKESARGKQVT